MGFDSELVIFIAGCWLTSPVTETVGPELEAENGPQWHSLPLCLGPQQQRLQSTANLWPRGLLICIAVLYLPLMVLM